MGAWVLAVGGVDPSGAGLDADREAATAAGVRLAEVATCHTDQTDEAVRAVGPVDPDRWRFDALAAASIENPGALKFGLLPGRAHLDAARAVTDQFAFEAPGMPVVVDPVIASSSGHVFVPDDDLDALRDLIARGTIVTPNLPELAALTGVDLELLTRDPGARLPAADRLRRAGARAVVVKAGHGTEDPAQDLVLTATDGAHWLPHPRLPGVSLRGSGCRFATALAAHLALAQSLPEAAGAASTWLATRLAAPRP